MRLSLRNRQRGSTLVVAITLIAVLTVVAAGMIRRGNAGMEAANARRQYDVAVSCAAGARQLRRSQFRAYGIDLTQITLDETAGNRRYATGHYDQFGISEKTVVPVDRSSIGVVGENAMDLSNRGIRVALGGAYYRITVVCSDSTSANRQSEVEFLVRFGL